MPSPYAHALRTHPVCPEAFVAGSRTGWRVRLPGGHCLATPAVVGGAVYVGGGFGSLDFYALDAPSGRPIWARRLSDDGPSAAVVARDRVAFHTESCTLFVLDAHDGSPCWSRWLGDPLLSQPAVSDGIVVSAHPTDAGRPHRLSAFGLDDGTPIWSVPIDGDVIGAPVIADRCVYVTTFGGMVHAVGLRDGWRRWSEPLRGSSAPCLSRHGLFVPCVGSDRTGGPVEEISHVSVAGRSERPSFAPVPAWYLDERTRASSLGHRERVERDTFVGFASGAPAAKTHVAAAHLGERTVSGLWEFQGSRPSMSAGGLVSVRGAHLSSVDPETERERWSVRLPGQGASAGGHLAAPPACAGRFAVVATYAGRLVGVVTATGETAFDIDLGEPVRFQPALSRGRAYVGTARGSVVCLDLGIAELDGWRMWGADPAHAGLAA